MAFFNSAVDVLQTLVVALGAGLGIWGRYQSHGGLRQRQPRCQVSGHEAAHGWRRRCSGGHHPDSSAVWSVRLRAAGGVSRLYIRNRSILAVDNSPLIRSALRYESPPINERRCYYAVFDPHYFSPESSQDPYQPLQLRTVTEWKPFSKPLPTGSKAS